MSQKPGFGNFGASSRVLHKDSNTIGQETVSRIKGSSRSLAEQHQEILRNIQSTNIGKPTIVEAQRILKIIEGLQDNLMVFQYLDAEFIGKFLDLQKGKQLAKELVNQLSPVCKELLKEQAELEAKYKPFAQIDQNKEEKEADEEKEDDKILERDKIYKQLETNFQNLLRYVKEHPDDFKIIQDLKPNLNQEILDLKHCIECWRIIYLKKLSTASEEQDSHIQQSENLKERIARLKKRKDSCEKDQRDLRADREQFQKEKKEEMEKLRSEKQEVKLNEKQDKERLDEEIEQQMKQRTDEHNKKKSDYEKTIEECKKAFEEDKKKNAEEEDKLKKTKTRAETLLAENIAVYDNMMEEKMQEKQELEDELDKIKKELFHLKRHFKKISVERAREEEVENIFREKRKDWEINERRKHAAAQHVQLAYKRFKESKGKKGKKGRKKKA